MTSKLKRPVCPWCGQRLRYRHGEHFVLRCPNLVCKGEMIGTKEMWLALIQAKQDLEIAREALEEIDTTRCIPQQTLISLGEFSKTTRFNAGNIICVATPDYIHNTLEQIKHKVKDNE